MKKSLISGLIAGLLVVAGCASTQNTNSLYADLGGKTGIADIVDRFLMHMGNNEVIVDSFAETDIEAFRGHLIDQICEVSGGPCEYTGRSMAESHAGLGVDTRQMNALVSDLINAMDDENVPLGAQNRLLGLLAPLHEDVVTR